MSRSFFNIIIACVMILFAGFTSPGAGQTQFESVLCVPYYGQGPSDFCWAACVQMVTQAASFEAGRDIASIIGMTGHTAAGVYEVTFRFDENFDRIVQQRCGVAPDRQMWDIFNGAKAADYVRDQLRQGRPVAIHFPSREHAMVVTGFDGLTFFVTDPQGRDAAHIGHTPHTWESLCGNMARGDNFVTFVVPRAIDPNRSEATINFMNGAPRMIQAGTGGARAGTYRWRYDHTRPRGASWQSERTDERIDTFPSTVTEIDLTDAIEVANISRTATRNLSIWLSVVNVDGSRPVYSARQSLTLRPNSSARPRLDRIPVDAFRSQDPTKAAAYVMTATLMEGSREVDKAIVHLAIEPPELATETMSLSVDIKAPCVLNEKTDWEHRFDRVNEEDEGILYAATGRVPFTMSGRTFQARFTTAVEWQNKPKNAEITLSGSWSADRKMIEQLSVNYALLAQDGNYSIEENWNFTAQRIPLNTLFRNNEYLEYTVSISDPSDREEWPNGFAVTAMGLLKNDIYEEMRGGKLQRAVTRRDRIDRNRPSWIEITLRFYIPMPAAAAPPAGTRTNRNNRTGARR